MFFLFFKKGPPPSWMEASPNLMNIQFLSVAFIEVTGNMERILDHFLWFQSETVGIITNVFHQSLVGNSKPWSFE